MKTDLTRTPGPWKMGAQATTGISGVRFVWGGQLAIARVPGMGNAAVNDSVVLANARLVASAPDLLDACKMAHDALEYFTDDCLSRAALALVRAAIAKAEGREAAR